MARAEHGDAERRWAEARRPEVGVGHGAAREADSRAERRDLTTVIPHDDRVAADLDRNVFVDVYLAVLGEHEVEEIVDVEPPFARHRTEVVALLLEVGAMALGVAVGELARERLRRWAEERLLEDRPHPPFDVAAEDDEATPALQEKEAVVGGELELGDREAAPAVEELAWQHVGDRGRRA